MPELFDYSWDNIISLSQNFATQLRQATKGEKSAFAFLKHPLPQTSFVTDNQTFQVMSLGGSTIETATARYQHKQVSVEQFQKTKLKRIDTKQDFIDQILDYINPETSLLALNFAYPIQPISREGKLDGELIKGTKEHTFSGLVGKLVGQELELEWIKRSEQQIQVLCANDVICLTLAALSQDSKIDPVTIFSMVLGTGNNFGLFIDKHTLVNLEAGNFNGFVQTPSGKFVDVQSSFPGNQWLEKEVAGAYLPQHFNYYAQELGLERRVSHAHEVDDLAKGDNPEAELALHLIDRSAAMIAGIFKGIWDYKQSQSLTSIIEGSLYWHGFNFPQRVEKYLDLLGVPNQAISTIKISHSNLVGAAQLAVFGD